MNTTEPLEDLNLVAPQDEILTEVAKDENSQTAQETSTAPDAEPSTTDEVKPEGDKPDETLPPEKTPEEIEAEKKAKNDKKAYEGKMSKLEREVNERREASKLEKQLAENTEETLTELVGNRAKFEKLKPYLAEKNPTWNLSYEEFVGQIKTAYTAQSQEDPNAIQKVNQIDLAQQKAQFQEESQTAESLRELKYELMVDVPEFRAGLRNAETANQTETDFLDAINLAGIHYKRIRQNGGEPDSTALIREALISLHPEWKITKQTNAVAKQQAKDDVKDILKQSASTTINNGTSNTVANLTPSQMAEREKLINFFINDCGNSKEEAIIKANQTQF